MSNFQAALLHGLKVLGHVALSGAVTALFAYLTHNQQVLLYFPAVNVAEATTWKWIFPADPFPTV